MNCKSFSRAIGQIKQDTKHYRDEVFHQLTNVEKNKIESLIELVLELEKQLKTFNSTIDEASKRLTERAS